jgi:hypothetical protein
MKYFEGYTFLLEGVWFFHCSPHQQTANAASTTQLGGRYNAKSIHATSTMKAT